jgi:hypothetical protein
MVGCEYNAVLTRCSRSVIKQSNLFGFGATEVVRFTTVSMTNMHITMMNVLHKFFAQLISEKDTRSNYNNSLGTRITQMFVSISDHDIGLATTSGDNNLTSVVVLHCCKCALLVRTKVHVIA